MRITSYSGLCWSLFAYLVSLLGTVLLTNERVRLWAILLLISASVIGVIVWGRQSWTPVFPSHPETSMSNLKRNRYFCWAGVAAAIGMVLVADFWSTQSQSFGFAGFLWLAGIGSLLVATLGWAPSTEDPPGEMNHLKWTASESILLSLVVLVAFVTRVWNLSSFPDNIYPDEIMTGTIATQSYLSGTNASPSVFSTVWHDVELPALWFWIVSLFLKLGGSTLVMLRLPAAFFGAATVLPFYGLVRATWGKYAAIAGAAILAFSVSNIHFSRLALNNITTQFFWTACFFFLLRGLRWRRPLDWALAGLSAGLSEYFYYGTRLLPFILLLFICYLLVFHWQQARQNAGNFLILVGGYFVGFGPLLFHFIRNPGLYLGRGASLMIRPLHIPNSIADLKSVWTAIWPVLSENLLGISTHSSQDIIFYAPLLLPVEGALLVLGLALLVWHWRHPAAVLILISGIGVLFVGGTLVAYPQSVPPLINHWTPGFPAFYVTLAVPIGAAIAVADAELSKRFRWLLPTLLTISLSLLGWFNLDFYFHRYVADPAFLKSSGYRSAQQTYEVQTAQSRFQASLGPGYEVFTVGHNAPVYDPVTTSYLVSNQKWTWLTDPVASLPNITSGDNGMAFLFFPGNEEYRELIKQHYPGGTESEVTSKENKHLFYAYVVLLLYDSRATSK